ncbi:helix-turn-helix transcriptional regulator [Marinitoga sp. 1155]|uniref:helix-turn-helix transcriptional regulator n=1 Tax=Marinitoga sp. 1155 TaxID=1428448 RepID=UPI0018CF33EE|nr:WYL domain-containing protein [Marinitoga sp. 1155]
MKYKKYIRILEVIVKISKNPGITTKDLSKKFKVSIRTIQKDLNVIEELGLNIERWADGSLEIKENMKLGKLDLSIIDKKALLLMMNISEKYLYDLFPEELQKLRIWILDSLNMKLRKLNETRANLYRFLNPRHEKIKLSVINSIEIAIIKNRKIKIIYLHPKHGEIIYILNPYLFLFSKSHWFVFAYESERNFETLFRISRIKTVELLEEYFKIPEEKILEEKINTIWEAQYSNKKYNIKIKFASEVAQIIEETIRHPTQKVEKLKNGDIIYDIEVSGYKEIIFWVLSWGKNAEILKPEWIRDKIKSEIENMYKKYKQNETEN